MLDLSIVIVNYNSRGLLRQCIKSLLQNLEDSKISYKIIVIDNNSHDGSIEMVREEFPMVRLIPRDFNSGYAKGVNVGIKSIEAGYYLIINPDTTIVQERAIERLIDFMDTHQAVGLAGPKLINPNGTTQVSCCRFPTFFYPLYRRTFLGKIPPFKKVVEHHLMFDWDHNSTRPVPWVIGTGMIVRGSTLKQVGLMDERYFMYFEDVDWCRKFWENDWKVYYIHDIEIVHYHGRDSAKVMGLVSIFNKQTRVHITSWLKYFLKYLGRSKINVPKKEK